MAVIGNQASEDEGIDIVIGASDAELAEMDEFVTTMHTRSGLLTEIRASGVTRPEAMARALDYVRLHVPTPRTAMSTLSELDEVMSSGASILPVGVLKPAFS